MLREGFLAQATVDQFTRDLARVGIRVYDPETLNPVTKVRKPVSPLALTTSEAKAAALGALAHTGMSGTQLNGLMGKVRITRRARVPVAAVIAGWAKRSRTPSARLARRVIGKVSWRHYKTIVFPQAALMLFASDIAVQFHPPGKKVPPAILNRRARAPAPRAATRSISSTRASTRSSTGSATSTRRARSSRRRSARDRLARGS